MFTNGGRTAPCHSTTVLSKQAYENMTYFVRTEVFHNYADTKINEQYSSPCSKV